MFRGWNLWTVGWLVASPLVLAAAPAPVGFAAAAVSAALWCRWLEQHPESTDNAQELLRAREESGR
jgi:hypothetical protein